VPRVRTNTEAISSEIGPIELGNCGSEPFKVGLEREVGIPTACVGLEARATYEDSLGFGSTSTFEVGSSSGENNKPGPHGDLNEMQGVGFDPQGLGSQAQNGSTAMSTSSLEIFSCEDTTTVHRS
jgi:hypothetical protein